MLLSTNRLTWDIEPEVEVYTRQAGPSHIQQVEAIILHFYFMVIQWYENERYKYFAFFLTLRQIKWPIPTTFLSCLLAPSLLNRITMHNHKDSFEMLFFSSLHDP